jgi:hypothetical protein
MSLGVPAVLRILTTACTPLHSSNALNADDESTRMHSKVSRTTEDNGIDVGSVGVLLRVELGVLVIVVARGTGDDRWRQVNKRSSSTYN